MCEKNTTFNEHPVEFTASCISCKFISVCTSSFNVKIWIYKTAIFYGPWHPGFSVIVYPQQPKDQQNAHLTVIPEP